MAFPSSGVSVKKDATYPDFHGSYTSRAIIEFSAQDYNTIYTQLKQDNEFMVSTSFYQFLAATLGFFNSKGIDIQKKGTILVGEKAAQFNVGFF